MGGAVKVVFGNMPSQGHEEECFSLCSSFIVCVAQVFSSTLHRYTVHCRIVGAQRYLNEWRDGSEQGLLSLLLPPPSSLSVCLFVHFFIHSTYIYSSWAAVRATGKEWDEGKFPVSSGWEPWPVLFFLFNTFYPLFWDVGFTIILLLRIAFFHLLWWKEMASLRAEGVGMKTLQLSGYPQSMSPWAVRGGAVAGATFALPGIWFP